MILENKIIKLINSTYKNIVNLVDDGFWYCNGFMAVKCNFYQHRIIAKLFELGAIEDYKQWKPRESIDLSIYTTIDKNKLNQALNTGYLKKLEYKKFNSVVFKSVIDNQFWFFDERFVEIFSGSEFYFLEDNGHVLYAFEDGELIGVILGIRDNDKEDTHKKLSEMIAG